MSQQWVDEASRWIVEQGGELTGCLVIEQGRLVIELVDW